MVVTEYTEDLRKEPVLIALYPPQILMDSPGTELGSTHNLSRIRHVQILCLLDLHHFDS